MTAVSDTSADRLMVYFRIRPVNANEKKQDGFESFFEQTTDQFVTVSGGKKYSCDGLLDPESQESVYKRVGKSAVDLAEEGYPAGIMCYGQTGTGKSHTLCRDEGDEKEFGIIPRAGLDLFQRASSRWKDPEISMQCVQIYRDSLQDLAASATNSGTVDDIGKPAAAGDSKPSNGGKSRSATPVPEAGSGNDTAADDDIDLEPIPHILQNKKLDIRYDSKTGVEILNVHSVPLKTGDDFMKLFRESLKHRTTAATKMNATSSRSHVAFIINITRRYPETLNTVRGKLLLIDLAGYERFGKTDIHDEVRKDEARSINASLLALGSVIQNLAQKSSHVPWRNSKLTRLMQDCVGGRARTSLILTLGPSADHQHETLGTLFFGSRAMNVAITSSQDVEVNFEAKAKKLQAMLDSAQERISELEDANRESERSVVSMEQQMKEEIERLQADHQRQIDEMVLRGEGHDRIAQSMRTFNAELETVLEQQMEQRSFTDADFIVSTAEKMKDQDNAFRQEKNDLTNEFSMALNNFEKDASDLKLRVEELEKEKETLRQRAIKAESDVECVELDLTMANSKISDLQMKVDVMEQEASTMQKRLEEMEDEEIQRQINAEIAKKQQVAEAAATNANPPLSDSVRLDSILLQNMPQQQQQQQGGGGPLPPPQASTIVSEDSILLLHNKQETEQPLPSSSSQPASASSRLGGATATNTTTTGASPSSQRQRADSLILDGSPSPQRQQPQVTLTPPQSGIRTPQASALLAANSAASFTLGGSVNLGSQATFVASPSPYRATQSHTRIDQAQTLRRMMIQQEEANMFALCILQFAQGVVRLGGTGPGVAGAALSTAAGSPATRGRVGSSMAASPAGIADDLDIAHPSNTAPQLPGVGQTNSGSDAYHAIDLSNSVQELSMQYGRLGMILQETMEEKSFLFERSTKLLTATIARATHAMKKELKRQGGADGAPLTEGGMRRRSESQISGKASSSGHTSRRSGGGAPHGNSHLMGSFASSNGGEGHTIRGVSMSTTATGGGLLRAGLTASQLRVSAQNRPESHRVWLYSGKTKDALDKQTKLGGKIPNLKPEQVMAESAKWGADQLDEYRLFTAYSFYVLGDHHSGKSSFTHCLTHKAPTFFKRAPNVQTPTLEICKSIATVKDLNVPCPAVPHGGLTSRYFDVNRLMKESQAQDTFCVEMKEVPDAVFKSMPAGSIPCRGAAFFLVYNLNDPKEKSRAWLLSCIQHLRVLCASTHGFWESDQTAEVEEDEENDLALGHSSSAADGESPAGDASKEGEDSHAARAKRKLWHPRLQVPCILIGTGRDQVAGFDKKEKDDSAIQASLRGQREWFEETLRSFASSSSPSMKGGEENREGNSSGAKSGVELVLLDSYAVSHASWEISGERPRSANSFEKLMQETIRYMSVHSPVNPAHFLPTTNMLLRKSSSSASADSPSATSENEGGDGEDADVANSSSNAALDVFWSTRQRFARDLNQAIKSGKDEEIAEALLHRAAVGVVTLFTSLHRWIEFAGSLTDYFVFDNLVRTHFGFTNPSQLPASTAASFYGRSHQNQQHQHHHNSGRDASTHEIIVQNKIRGYQNKIIRYFHRWCLTWGFFDLYESSNDFSVIGLRGKWRDEVLSRLFLPKILRSAQDATDRAKLPCRQWPSLVETCKARLSIDFDVSTTKAELLPLQLGQMSMRFMQRALTAPLDAVASNAETALLVLSALGLSRSGSMHNNRTQALAQSHPHLVGPGRLEFFMPVTLTPASSNLCNYLGFCLNIYAEGAILQGTITIRAAAKNLFPLIQLDLAASGEANQLYAWSNCIVVQHRNIYWAMAAILGDTIHVCVAPKSASDPTTSTSAASPMASPRPQGAAADTPNTHEGGPVAAAVPDVLPSFEWILDSAQRCSSLYPLTSVEAVKEVNPPTVHLWSQIESTLKELLPTNMNFEQKNQQIAAIQSQFERTSEPKLETVVLGVV